MNANNATSHALTIPGTVSSSGNYKITLTHPRSGLTTGLAPNVIMSGNNTNLSCTWDVTTASLSAAGGSYICLKGIAANSLGTGLIKVGSNNKVSFDHAQSIGILNDIILSDNAKAIVNADVNAKSLTLGTTVYTTGTFNATSHPAYFEGTGTLTLGTTSVKKVEDKHIYFTNNTLFFGMMVQSLEIYDLTGRILVRETVNSNAKHLNLQKGIYIVKTKGTKDTVMKIIVE
jgi:hypothetical protein